MYLAVCVCMCYAQTQVIIFSILLIRFGFERRESFLFIVVVIVVIFLRSFFILYKLFRSIRCACVCVWGCLFGIYIVVWMLCTFWCHDHLPRSAHSPLVPCCIGISTSSSTIGKQQQLQQQQQQQLKDTSNTWQPLANSLYGHVMRSFTARSSPNIAF